jgi:hypothetical protein
VAIKEGLVVCPSTNPQQFLNVSSFLRVAAIHKYFRFRSSH